MRSPLPSRSGCRGAGQRSWPGGGPGAEGPPWRGVHSRAPPRPAPRGCCADERESPQRGGDSRAGSRSSMARAEVSSVSSTGFPQSMRSASGARNTAHADARQNRPQSRRPHRGFSLRAIAEPRRRPAVPTTHCPAVLGGRDTPGRVSIRRRFHIRTEGGGSMARRVSDPRSCGIHNPGPLPSSQCPRIGSHSAVPAGGLAPRARGPLPSDSPGPRLITVVSHLPSPGLTFSLLSLLTLKK